MAVYTSRDEAIADEIIAPIEAGEASAGEYDIDAIADAVLGSHAQGYALREGIDFWAVVADHDRPSQDVQG